VTFDEADARIKELCGPFARAVDRASDPGAYEWPGRGVPRYYVGWKPRYGNGDTWEAAFADLRRDAEHVQFHFRTARLPPLRRTKKAVR
jgi:hypothetical protein